MRKKLAQQTLIINSIGEVGPCILLYRSKALMNFFFLTQSRIVITQATSHVSGGDLSSNPKREVRKSKHQIQKRSKSPLLSKRKPTSN
jgi:hypothetical protein